MSRRSGLPITTIKFYIREGILPRGELTAPNQSQYDEDHLRRLTLIGTLRRAGLSLAIIKRALQAMDTMREDSPAFMAIAVGSLEPCWRGIGNADSSARIRATAMLQAMVEHRGWQVDESVPIWHEVVRALAMILSNWVSGFPDAGLDRYAAVAEELASFELPDTWDPTTSPAEALTYVVQGTLLFEPLILALRRLAHVDRGQKLRSRRRGRAAPAADDGGTPTV